jgi:hypothetical protein
MKTYSVVVPVVRLEVQTVTELDLHKERLFQLGKEDRLNKRPCRSAEGAYLNGYYNPETAFYYITAAFAHLL